MGLSFDERSVLASRRWGVILGDWKKRIDAFQQLQYRKAIALERRHYLIGVPAAIFAAIVGTTVFATLSKDFTMTARLTVAFFSIAAAVLAGLQTFLNYGKRAEQHRAVASQFGTIRREIDILDGDPPETIEAFRARLRNLNAMIAKVSDDAPLIDSPNPPNDPRDIPLPYAG
jgi:hypothetical protein